MKIIITKRTRVRSILPYLYKEGRAEKIMESVPAYPLEKSIYDMTIGEFISIIENEEQFVNKIMRPRERALIAFGRLRTFKTELQNLKKTIEMFQLKQTNEEKQAAVGIMFPDNINRMLITVTQFFHLHSFKEAESIPLGDYLLILQEQYSSIQYQRNYQKILDSQTKIKKKNGR